MEHFDVIGTPFSVCFGATEHYTGNRFLFLYLKNYPFTQYILYYHKKYDSLFKIMKI